MRDAGRHRDALDKKPGDFFLASRLLCLGGMDLPATRLTTLVDANDFWRSWQRERAFFVRMCRRWLPGQRHEVEDVLSHGALKALHFLQRNPGRVRRFRPWALRILYNLCIDQMRARSRGVLLDRGDEEQVCESPRGHLARPDHEVFRGELGTALDQAIAALPPRLRRTFELRFLEVMPYTEIAEQLEISEENARKRIQQARILLRRELREYGFWGTV